MKAILEFNLPEEQTEHRAAVQALDWKYVVTEMDEYFRSQIKYQDLSGEVTKALQAARDNLHELCNDNNINIHE
jgi:hypothetical protein